MSTFLTDYPITQKKLEEILDLVRLGETVTTLWMPHSARTDFAIRLAAKQGLPAKDWAGFEFFVLDLSLDPPYLDQKVEEIKHEVHKNKNRSVVILDNFNLEKAALIKYIFSWRHDLPPDSLSFLILAFESEFFQKTQKTDMSMIYHNIITVPYYTKEEAFAWLGNAKDKEVIYKFCGGIFGLLKNFQRAMRVSKNIEEAKTCPMMLQTLEHLWGRFSERERLVLTTAARNEHLPPYSQEINYMKTHLLLSENNELIGDWAKLLVGAEQEVKLIKKDGAILYNGTNLLEIFTPAEQKIFMSLLDQKSLSREGVAKLLWGQSYQDRFSDWAIDQTMSRIRRKLQTAGLSPSKLKTLKGEGFRINSLQIA